MHIKIFYSISKEGNKSLHLGAGHETLLECQWLYGSRKVREAEAGGSRGQEIETILVNTVKPRLY